MQDVAERLYAVEERLAHVLASGWRHAGADAEELAREVDALAGYGLPELATRLRRVTAAQDVGEALPAIALASSACRLLRARLPADAPPEGEWRPLLPAAPARQPARDQVLPLARVPVDGTEVWVCQRVRGGIATELVLINQPSFQTPAPANASPGLGSAEGEAVAWAEPWLRSIVSGRLHWRERRPIGAAGEIDRCTMEGPTWMRGEESRVGATLYFRKELMGDRAGTLLAEIVQPGGSGALRTAILERAAADDYAWLDPMMQEVFVAFVDDRAWAMVWARGALTVPLALLVANERDASASLIHLVPGKEIHESRLTL